MITLIHGSDTAASRKYFSDEKQKVQDVVVLDAEKFTYTDLHQIFDGGGLFGETKSVFIEQLITKRKKTSDFQIIIKYLEKKSQEHHIILWEGKELESSNIKLVKNAEVKVFKLPQSLFLFLDSIKPGNGKQLVNLFHQTIENAEVEIVFFMLIRQIRLLLALSDTKTSQNEPIDELKRMAPWQKTKLQHQSALFTTTQLLSLYENLYYIEYGQKTGGLPADLTTMIDFLLLEV